MADGLDKDPAANIGAVEELTHASVESEATQQRWKTQIDDNQPIYDPTVHSEFRVSEIGNIP